MERRSIEENGERSLNRRAVRRYGWRLAACFAAALVLQLPLAWAIVYFYVPSWQGETSVIVGKPPGCASNVDRVRIENDTQPGIRWVVVTGWSSSYSQAVFRTDEERLFVDEPTWPFPAEEVFPGLVDVSKWPSSAPGGVGFVAGTYGETMVEAYAIGWPFLCATGRSVRDVTTGKWTTTGGILAQWPRYKQRHWLALGLAPLCYTPRWAGVAANTVSLGAMLFAAWAAAPLVSACRKWRRRRRGMCSGCAYDLRGLDLSAACPECGLRR